MLESLGSAFGGGLFGGRRRAACVTTALAGLVIGVGAAGAAKAPVQSIVAEARVPSVPVYTTPGAKRPFLRISNPNTHGARLVFLVKQRRNGWERVYLPRRPNGAIP